MRLSRFAPHFECAHESHVLYNTSYVSVSRRSCARVSSVRARLVPFTIVFGARGPFKKGPFTIKRFAKAAGHFHFGSVFGGDSSLEAAAGTVGRR